MEVIYSKSSCASGALVILIKGCQDEICSPPVLMVLNRNDSLQLSTSGIFYQAFVYDIERDGTLANGVVYPAVIRELATSK